MDSKFRFLVCGHCQIYFMLVMSGLSCEIDSSNVQLWICSDCEIFGLLALSHLSLWGLKQRRMWGRAQITLGLFMKWFWKKFLSELHCSSRRGLFCIPWCPVHIHSEFGCTCSITHRAADRHATLSLGHLHVRPSLNLVLVINEQYAWPASGM